MDEALEARGITKAYKSVEVLRWASRLLLRVSFLAILWRYVDC